MDGRRVPALDGLRGLAFLAVHGFHALVFGPAPGGSALVQLYHYAALQAWVGVDLFFVISGFLITGILLRTTGEPGWARRFYARRALRILPVYYLVLLGTLFLLPAILPWTRPIAEVPRENLGWYATFSHNWLNLVENGWPAGDQLVGQLWSLGVEEQFYLVWPLAVALLGPRRLRVFALLMIVVAPAIRFGLASAGFSYDATYAFTPCRADSLAAGALLALLAARGRMPSRRSAWMLAAGGGFLFWATPRLVSVEGMPELHLRNMAFTWSLFMWSGVLCLAHQDGWPARLLSFKPLRFVGFHSYTLYLVTYPLCYVAGSVWERHGPDLPGFLSHAAFFASTLGVGLVLAWASWHLVEKRFLSRWGKAPVFR